MKDDALKHPRRLGRNRDEEVKGCQAWDTGHSWHVVGGDRQEALY